jgi:hypothetical protein
LTSDAFDEVAHEAIRLFPEMDVVLDYNPRNHGNVLIAPDGELTTEMDEHGVIEPDLGNVFLNDRELVRAKIRHILEFREENRLALTYNQFV